MIEKLGKATLDLLQDRDYEALSQKKYSRLLNRLRVSLMKSQRSMQEAPRPVIIVVTGMDGAGKGEAISRLNEWLDPRLLDTHSFWKLSEEAGQRPLYWRYWKALPTRGRLAIWFGGWYEPLLMEGISRTGPWTGMDREAERIRRQEEMLCQDGALILKFWFHLSRAEQKQRLDLLHRQDRPNWRAMEDDWGRHRIYDHVVEVAGRMLESTSRPRAPWFVVPSIDRLQRNLMLADLLSSSLEKAVRTDGKDRSGKPGIARHAASRNFLAEVDLDQALDPDAYQEQLVEQQYRLHRLFWKAYRKGISTVLVFEGWDAAGKGGAIRRAIAAIDPRLYRIVQTGPPTMEEHGYHYLWRFWRDLPRDGRIAIFDRSWYGRVLVERVEGFASDREWQRAYHEINEFESEVVRHGSVLLKFWIHISKEKQLQRFQSRMETPHKQHKITEDDWRNRERWDDYEAAVNDMVGLTDSPAAPWILVAGNNKRHARIQSIRALCDRLERALKRSEEGSPLPG